MLKNALLRELSVILNKVMQNLLSPCVPFKNMNIISHKGIILPFALSGNETVSHIKIEKRLRMFVTSVPGKIYGPKKN